MQEFPDGWLVMDVPRDSDPNDPRLPLESELVGLVLEDNITVARWTTDSGFSETGANWAYFVDESAGLSLRGLRHVRHPTLRTFRPIPFPTHWLKGAEILADG